MSDTKTSASSMQQDWWKDAREFHLSVGGAVLQFVGLDSPTHTLFGRIHHHDVNLNVPKETYSVQQVLEWMLDQVQMNRQEALELSATDLLRLGAVWKLTAPTNDDGTTRCKLKRQRQFLQHATDPLYPDITSLRVYFRPSRFPAAYSVDWTLPPHQSAARATTKPFCILDCNFNQGHAVIDKPSGLASHATVDNGVENVLYQVQQQLLAEKLSLPHRLDIETQGLLVVALKPEFASYIASLLRQKTLSCETRGIYKEYKCLVRLSSKEQRDDLVRRVSTDDIVEHYMDPNSAAPKTFQLKPREGWLKCALRILDVGPVMKWMENSDETANNGTDVDGGEVLVQLRVDLLTGRTHQIRGQLAAMNMPLVGDPLYGPQSCECKEWDERRNRGNVPTHDGEMERLGLQCCKVSFLTPKWSLNDKKKKRALVPDELGGYRTYRLDEAWWSDRLVRVD